MLSDYKQSCKEVNNLYLAANQLIKTIELARTSLLEGNDNSALLNYNMVAELLKDPKQASICYNNIACIHLRLREFDKHHVYCQQSIDIIDKEMRNMPSTSISFNVTFIRSLLISGRLNGLWKRVVYTI